MKLFKNLSVEENDTLMKFPVYIALLAANSDNELDEEEKKVSIDFAHIKTFSCDPLLSDFYKSVNINFEKNLLEIDKNLPRDKNVRESTLKKELTTIEKLLPKLGAAYNEVMNRSMSSFKEHVSKAHRNTLVNFIFPIPISGLTD